MLRLAAWMAYDTGRHGLAQQYMTKALHLARGADNRMLGGRTLAGMSHQANYLGHYGMAVNLAQAALKGLDYPLCASCSVASVCWVAAHDARSAKLSAVGVPAGAV